MMNRREFTIKIFDSFEDMELAGLKDDYALTPEERFEHLAQMHDLAITIYNANPKNTEKYERTFQRVFKVLGQPWC